MGFSASIFECGKWKHVLEAISNDDPRPLRTFVDLIEKYHGYAVVDYVMSFVEYAMALGKTRAFEELGQLFYEV